MTNLAAQLRADLVSLAGPAVLDHVDVVGIDRLARQVVTRVHGSVPSILAESEVKRAWEDAVDGLPDLISDDRAAEAVVPRRRVQARRPRSGRHDAGGLLCC